MSTLLQAIEDVLRPALLCRGPIELREDEPQSYCRPVALKKNGRAVVLKVDNRDAAGSGRSVSDWLFPLFRTNAPGIARICDYIVFYRPRRSDSPLAAPLFVFLCELKSGTPGGALAQVANGRLMADHIIAMAGHHGDVHEAPEIVYRALIFSTGVKSPKGTMKPGPLKFWPAEHMPDVTFAHFACGSTQHLGLLCE